MPTPSDLVHETSATTGTGNFTLANANGKRSFNTAFGTGGSNVFDYYISNRDAAEWERGTGSLSAATTLVRDTVIASSNANAAVNFSSGTKDVINDIPAANQARLDAAQTWTALNTYSLGGVPIRVVNTTDNASVQALKLEGDRASPAANDEVYESFFLSDSAGNQEEFGRVTVRGTTVTNSSEASRMQWGVRTGGTLADEIYLTGTNFYPAANDGNALGLSGTAWADLFLADGGVINWNAGNATLTHSAGILTSNAQISIVKATPVFLIDSSSGAAVVRIDGASGADSQVEFQENGTRKYLFYSQGSDDKFVILDSDSSVNVSLTQDFTAWTFSSDGRLPQKQNRRPITVLDKLKHVQLIEYGAGHKDIGFVAQDLYKDIPQLVVKGDDKDRLLKDATDPGMWGIKQDLVGLAALQAVKELLARVEALETKIVALGG